MKVDIIVCEEIRQEAKFTELCFLWNSVWHITSSPFIFLVNREFSWSIEQI